ncbi:hypothetical protein TorRG33x02_325090 [Trema orientale]|uniref:Uncharacterized protein n=1 Tax=Trema orientale TaxID=63057 RepID=A0A2P5BDL3_TREOI|nr:hypothetical protein TorRG33x02_325090 [Trema orientale]
MIGNSFSRTTRIQHKGSGGQNIIELILVKETGMGSNLTTKHLHTINEGKHKDVRYSAVDNKYNRDFIYTIRYEVKQKNAVIETGEILPKDIIDYEEIKFESDNATGQVVQTRIQRGNHFGGTGIGWKIRDFGQKMKECGGKVKHFVVGK